LGLIAESVGWARRHEVQVAGTLSRSGCGTGTWRGRIAARKEKAERWRRSRILSDYLAAVRAHVASVRVVEVQARDLEA
jgi:hypothetical protein